MPEPEHLPGKVLADRPHAPSKPEASAKPTVTTDAGYAPIMAAVDMYTEAQILKHIHQLQRPHRPFHYTVTLACGYMHSKSIQSHTARPHLSPAKPRRSVVLDEDSELNLRLPVRNNPSTPPLDDVGDPREECPVWCDSNARVRYVRRLARWCRDERRYS